MKTKILLTVDTEFSIAGAFYDPINNKPLGLQSVLCEKDGQSHGLGFILDTLNKYDIKGTFFIEVLNANYFGHGPMGEIAHTIVDRGQDIQMHLHPCWQYFKDQNWQEQLKLNPPKDDISQLPYQKIESLISEGLHIFSQWGLAPPTAMRTGSLCVNKDVYKAMDKTGIKISSNIGVGNFKPLEDELQFYSGCHEIENCYELPVLTYCSRNLYLKKHLKILTITGSSWEEIEFLLISATEKKLDYVVILTHPAEFIKRSNNQYTTFVPNKTNKNRLERLCQFLNKNKEKFVTTSFSDLQSAGATITNSSKNILIESSFAFAIKRISENFISDVIV